MPIGEYLELLETAIIMIYADLRQYDKLEEIIQGGKFSKFNEEDVTMYLEANNKSEALALIFQFSG